MVVWGVLDVQGDENVPSETKCADERLLPFQLAGMTKDLEVLKPEVVGCADTFHTQLHRFGIF